jgi:hypothetical protein
MRRWILKVCPLCNFAVAQVHAPVHMEGCSRPNCEQVVVEEVRATTR